MMLWWIANGVLLLVVLPVVVVLANQVVRCTIEVDRYAADIVEHGVGITKQLEPLPATMRTQNLTVRTKSCAITYIDALDLPH